MSWQGLTAGVHVSPETETRTMTYFQKGCSLLSSNTRFPFLYRSCSILCFMILPTTLSSRTMSSISCVKPSRCFQCPCHGCLPAGSLPRGAAKAPPFTSPQAHSLIFPKSLGVEKLYSKLHWPIIQCIYQFPVIWRFTLKKKKSSNKCSIKNRKYK